MMPRVLWLSAAALRGFLAATLAFFIALPAPAAETTSDEVPAELREWIPWVRAELGTKLCTHIGGEPRCVWPGELELELDAAGGQFEQRVLAEARLLHRLPGRPGAWPEDVEVDGKPAAVVDEQGAPAVVLGPGRSTIRGRFVWHRLPEVLDVGPLTGVVSLRLAGKEVPLVRREAGQLWLKGLSESALEGGASDQVELAVFRQIRDGLPMIVETRLVFRVSGSAREISLPDPNLKDTVALAVEGDLALSLERSGALRVQLVPGRHELTLLARRSLADGPLSRPPASEPWPVQEVWTWHPDTALRVVELTGAPGIDPSRTDLPVAWKSDAAFLVGAGDGLDLKTTRRGQEQVAPNRVDLVREFWLDEAAATFTVRDQLSGSLSQGFRVDLLSGVLGQVRSSDQEQVITLSPSGRGSGVEVRDAALSVEAVSRLPRGRDLAAVGWSEDANSLSATLHLPPGWDVLWSSGVDQMPGTWLARWDLFAVFFLVLLSVAMWRLTGPLGGAAAFVALLLAHGEEDAPTYVWIVLVILSVLHALITHVALRRVVRISFFAVGVLVLAELVAFSVAQVRHAIYPHLDSSAEHTLASSTMSFSKAEDAPAPPAAEPLREDMMQKPAAQELAVAGKRGGGYALDSLAGALGSAADSSSGNVASAKDDKWLARQVPADAVVQTGPGIPDAVARSFSLGWSGPVVKDHRMRLVLLPPWAMRVTTVLRLLALGLLGLALFRSLDRSRIGPPGAAGFRPTTENPRKNRRRAAEAMTLVLCILGSSRVAFASEPSDERLAELERRLLRPPACGESCISVPRLTLGGDDETLRLEVLVHAAAQVAYRLPGPAEALGHVSVSLDGRPASDLRLEPDGALYLRLDPGVHRVRIDARLPSDRVTLEVGTPPQRVAVETRDWSVSGVGEDGRVQGGTLVFQREARPKTGGQAPDAAGDSHVSVVPYFSVVRRFQLGIAGQVTTTATRLSDPSSPEVLRLALLPGERVTTPGVEVSGGVAVLTFPREERQTTIESTLTLPKSEQPLALVLAAPPASSHSEVWSLQCGVVWHCTMAGLVPTARVEDGATRSTFHPWPGEKLELSASWPKPSPGQSLTIESATLLLTPGIRLGRGELTLALRTSQSALHPIDLPPSARLEEVLVDGAPQAARAEGRRVRVALAPGAHQVVVRYHDPRGLGALFQSPAVSVGAPGVNFRVQVTVPAERWLLLAGGPAQGPAVLLWGYLVLIGIAALLLPRLPLSTLRARDWFLLGLGLTQIPAFAAVFVAGWFFAIASRPRWAHVRGAKKDIGQFLLLLYTLGFVLTLTVAVYQGLVSSPDMEVEGTGSSAQNLNWYLDRSAGSLPRVWIYSVSIWVWRAVMLAWSLWLARALLGWLRFAWTTLLEGGFWSPPRPKQGTLTPVAPAPEGAASAALVPEEPAADEVPRPSVPELIDDLPPRSGSGPPGAASQRPPEPEDEK